MKQNITRQQIRELRSRLSDASDFIQAFKMIIETGDTAKRDTDFCKRAGKMVKDIHSLLALTS
jgi:hypothetical protein